MRNRENISLSRLLTLYSTQEQLKNYNQPQKLYNQLSDLKNLFVFAETDFPTKIKNLKKRADDYLNQLQTASDSVFNLVQYEVPTNLIYQANQRLAYDILARSTQQKEQQVQGQQGYDIQFEMKLKFIQSEGIQANLWGEYYDKAVRMIKIGDLKINIEIGIKFQKGTYLWTVNEVYYSQKPNQILKYYYLESLLPWIRNHYENSQKKIINYLIKSIPFCESVLLFKTIQQRCRENNFFELGDFKLITKIQDKQYRFIFPEIKTNQRPNFKLLEGDRQLLLIPFDNDYVKGTFTICSQKLQCDFINHHFTDIILIDWVKTIHNYQKLMQQFRDKYLFHFQNNLHLLIKYQGNYWKDQQTQLKDQILSETKNNGLYIVFKGQISSIVIQITNNLSFSSKYINSILIEKGLTCFSQNSLQLNINLFYHLELHKQIIQNNSKNQHKIYDMQLSEEGSIFIFRLHKYLFQECKTKIFSNDDKNNRSFHDRQAWQEDRASEDHEIQVKITKDFKKITFYTMKPYRPEQKFDISSNYQHIGWRQYLDRKLVTQQLLIFQITKCLQYLLEHFSIERFFNRKIKPDNQRNIKLKL